MTLTSITPFTMTRQVAELLWGQILKDAEFYDQRDAARFVTILGELGYDFNGDDFMSREADTLLAVADADGVECGVWSVECGVWTMKSTSSITGSGGIDMNRSATADRDTRLALFRCQLMAYGRMTHDASSRAEWKALQLEYDNLRKEETNA